MDSKLWLGYFGKYNIVSVLDESKPSWTNDYKTEMAFVHKKQITKAYLTRRQSKLLIEADIAIIEHMMVFSPFHQSLIW